MNPVIEKLGNISAIKIVDTFETQAQGVNFMVGTTEFFVPLAEHINVEEELAKMQKELEYQEKFLASVMAKLSNEKFVSKAPAKVIELENKKKADAESKIESLKGRIAQLK